MKIGLDVERRFSVILAQLAKLKASEMEKERLIPKAYKKGPFRKKSKKKKKKKLSPSHRSQNRQIETEITVSHKKSSCIRFQFRQIRFELDEA